MAEYTRLNVHDMTVEWKRAKEKKSMFCWFPRATPMCACNISEIETKKKEERQREKRKGGRPRRNRRNRERMNAIERERNNKNKNIGSTNNIILNERKISKCQINIKFKQTTLYIQCKHECGKYRCLALPSTKWLCTLNEAHTHAQTEIRCVCSFRFNFNFIILYYLSSHILSFYRFDDCLLWCRAIGHDSNEIYVFSNFFVIIYRYLSIF